MLLVFNLLKTANFKVYSFKVKHVEQCEMVIALLHGGLKDAEDLNLANVQGVDLVIAGTEVSCF